MDRDSKTISKQEFVQLMSAGHLGDGGFDPTAQATRAMQRGKTKV